MTVPSDELQRRREAFEEARDASGEAQRELEARLREEQEAAREVERLEAEIERIEEEQEADTLLADADGGTATASGTKKKLQRLRGQVSEIRGRVKGAKKAKAKADERLEEAAVSYARALREARESDRAAYLESLGDLGRAALAAYPQVREAVGQLTTRDRELKEAVSAADASPLQRRRLRNYVRRGDQDLDGDVLLGFLVHEVVSWARRFGRGPLPEFLRQAGMETVDGSPRHHRPFRALEDLIAAVEDARLPGGTTKL